MKTQLKFVLILTILVGIFGLTNALAEETNISLVKLKTLDAVKSKVKSQTDKTIILENIEKEPQDTVMLNHALDSSLWTYFDTNNTGGIIGLSVYSHLKDSQLIDFNADSLFTPASTLKVLTTATALEEMDLDWRPITRIQLRGIQTKSKLEGELQIIGGGDPNFSGRYFKSAFESIEPMVKKIADLGLDTIVGEILIDASYFKDPARPTSWENRFYNKWYGAEVSGLAFNDNCFSIKVLPGENVGDSVVLEILPDVGFVDVKIDVKTVKGRRNRMKMQHDQDSNIVTLSGSMGVRGQAKSYVLPIRDAPQYFKRAFMKVMADYNIYFEKSKLQRNQKKELMMITSFNEVIEHEGVPLLSLLDEINQRSQNFHAETLLRQIGYVKYKEASIAKGVQAEKEFLARLGLAKDTARIKIEDGSGLSYGNKTTPKLMTTLLDKMLKHPRKEYFIRSMAEPRIAVSGQRLKELTYPWSVKYKSGFVNQSQGLNGYLFTSQGDTLSISLYFNKYKISDTKIGKMTDSIWIKLANHYDRERPSMIDARRLHRQVDIVGLGGTEWLNSTYHQRILKFSNYFLDRPYGHGGPTGEGMYAKLETKPLINTLEVDCVTYIESVMALALSKKSVDILGELQKVRYLNGQIDYHRRRHFFVEDWVYGNPEMINLKSFENDTIGIRISNRTKFYGYKKIKIEVENPKTPLKYLQLDSAVKKFKKPWDGKPQILGFGLIGKLDWLWVTHTGFLILEPGKMPIMRHASLQKNKVVDMDFSLYLKSRQKSLDGVMFFEFISPGDSSAKMTSERVMDEINNKMMINDSQMLKNSTTADIDSVVKSDVTQFDSNIKMQVKPVSKLIKKNKSMAKIKSDSIRKMQSVKSTRSLEAQLKNYSVKKQKDKSQHLLKINSGSISN